MQRIYWLPLLPLALCAVLMVGCEEQTPPAAPPTPDTPEVPPVEPDVDATAEADGADAGVTGDAVLRDVDRALRTTGDYTKQEMQQFVEASEEKLEALKAKWSQWSEGAGEKSGELKEDFSQKYDEAKQKLEKLKDSSGDAWGEVKSGFVNAYNDLEEATRQAANKLGDDEQAATDDAAEPAATTYD